MTALAWIVAAAGVAPQAAVFATVLGLGVLHGLGPVHVALAAALFTVLPTLGVRMALGNGPWATAAAAWIWPACVVAGLPGFVPGGLREPFATGASVLAAPAGRAAAARAARLADDWLAAAPAAPAGHQPAPEAERALPDCLPAAAPLREDAVALPYEGRGHSMVIPVAFGDVEMPMLFDTGASLTTLNADALRRIGVRVPADAPSITLHTANGDRDAQVVVVPSLWVGGMEVRGVTVGVCEECADGRTAGLLGLNVSGQFLVTVDTVRKEVVFQARSAAPERLIDVLPWLSVEASARVYPDTRVEVDVTGISRAPRAIAEARVHIRCGDAEFYARLADIPPGGRVAQTVRLPRGSDCEAYTVAVDSARW